MAASRDSERVNAEATANMSCELTFEPKFGENEACSPAEEEQKRALGFLSPSVIAWIAMVLAVLSGATVGPVFKYLANFHVQPCMSASWRGQTMVIFLLPLVILEHFACKNKTPLLQRWKTVHSGSTNPLIVDVMLCGLGWSGMLLLWIVGLRLTTTVKAAILASTHPLMLVIYLTITGKPVSRFEWIGVFVVLFGLLISAFIRENLGYYWDELTNHHHHGNQQFSVDSVLSPMQFNTTSSFSFSGESMKFPKLPFLSAMMGIQESVEFVESTDCSGDNCGVSLMWELFGDLLCLGSAFCQCLTIVVRVRIPDKEMPLLQYSFLTALVVTVVSTIGALALESIPMHVDGSEEIYNQPSQVFCQDVWCVFGWSNKEWLAVTLSFGFFTGCICVAGFNYAMKNIAPLIFSAFTMLDPAVTGLLSWSVGLEGVPDTGVMLGGSIVTVGIALLTIGESRREGHSDGADVVSQKAHEFDALPTCSEHAADRDEPAPASPIRNDTKTKSFEIELSPVSVTSSKFFQDEEDEEAEDCAV